METKVVAESLDKSVHQMINVSPLPNAQEEFALVQTRLIVKTERMMLLLCSNHASFIILL